jgi:hypothetical protein
MMLHVATGYWHRATTELSRATDAIADVLPCFPKRGTFQICYTSASAGVAVATTCTSFIESDRSSREEAPVRSASLALAVSLAGAYGKDKHFGSKLVSVDSLNPSAVPLVENSMVVPKRIPFVSSHRDMRGSFARAEVRLGDLLKSFVRTRSRCPARAAG